MTARIRIADAWRGNIDRFSGFADVYDRYRPQPPEVIPELLCRLAGTARPALVVDLGCGTGLSTRIWGGRARRVIGIDPADDMRRQARRRTRAPNVSYLPGLSHRTHLPDRCADIVTCSQSLHWMQPRPTFAEARRILRPGGVFAAIDCDWPPTLGAEIEQAYRQFREGIARLERRHRLSEDLKRWCKSGHLKGMAASGCFRWTKEILVHNVEMGNADRLVGLAKSMGSVAGLLKLGLTQRQIGLADLRLAARRFLGSRRKGWYFSYRVRVGVV